MNHVPQFLLLQLPACGFHSMPLRLPELTLCSIARITARWPEEDSVRQD